MSHPHVAEQESRISPPTTPASGQPPVQNAPHRALPGTPPSIRRRHRPLRFVAGAVEVEPRDACPPTTQLAADQSYVRPGGPPARSNRRRSDPSKARHHRDRFESPRRGDHPISATTIGHRRALWQPAQHDCRHDRRRAHIGGDQRQAEHTRQARSAAATRRRRWQPGSAPSASSSRNDLSSRITSQTCPDDGRSTPTVWIVGPDTTGQSSPAPTALSPSVSRVLRVVYEAWAARSGSFVRGTAKLGQDLPGVRALLPRSPPA
jgi:hypothetical protein